MFLTQCFGSLYSSKPVFDGDRKAILKKNKISQKAAKELVTKMRNQLLKPDGAVESSTWGYVGDGKGGFYQN